MGELFVNPALLGGLGLVVAPVVIHLLNRRRYRIVDWAAMDFLLRAATQSRRRIRLEDLLLLLLRMAIIALLVLAVARPVVRGVGAGSEDERIVLIDDSGSMGSRGGTGTVHDRARESAAGHVRDAIGRGIPVTLWRSTALDPAAPRVPREERADVGAVGRGQDPDGVRDGSALLRSLDASRPTDGRLRLAETFQRLGREAGADGAPRRRSLVIVGDLRASDWMGPDGDLRPAVDGALRDLEQADHHRNVSLRLVDLAADAAPNLAITAVRVEPQPVLAGRPVRIEVEVTNVTGPVRARVDGQLEVGGPDGESFTVAHRLVLPAVEGLEPGASRSVEVRHVFPSPGGYPLRARIDPDRLPGDDVDHLVVRVRESVRVLVVDGEPRGERLASEAGFLLAALRPAGGEASGVEPLRHTGEITSAALVGRDVVLVLNRERLAPAEVEALTGFARRGGGIGWFLGSRVDPEAWASLRAPADAADAASAAEDDSAVRLLPARLRRLADVEESRLLREEIDHPLWSAFRGFEGASLGDVRFHGRLGITPDPGVSVVARFDDDRRTPAILASGDGRGRGRVVVCNTSADRDWSDWPTDPSYPVFLHELVRWLTPTVGETAAIEVGEPVRCELASGGAPVVLDPAGERLEVSVEDDSAWGRTPPTARAGLYRVVMTPTPTATGGAGRSVGARWVACRWPRSESDLRPVDRERLLSLLRERGIEASIGIGAGSGAPGSGPEGEVWRWLALAAGLFLVGELALAWWLGGR